MLKDFRKWMSVKEKVQFREKRLYFHERELWWCNLGLNVGFEEDGKGDTFRRPVLVFKKFNKEVFSALPVTTKTKANRYHFSIALSDDTSRSVILSQLRLVDAKRLVSKIETLSLPQYSELKKEITRLVNE